MISTKFLVIMIKYGFLQFLHPQRQCKIFLPLCGARKMLRAYADPCIFRPLQKSLASFIRHRRRKPVIPKALLLFGFAIPARTTLPPSGGFSFAQSRRTSSSFRMASLSALPETLFLRVIVTSTVSQALPRISVFVFTFGVVTDHPALAGR